MNTKRLWIGLVAVVLGSFAVLGYFGYQIYVQEPPQPSKVVDTTGRTIFTGMDIKDGQNVWQSIGGQETGTVWGHGAYVAPDWSADWLHREATALADTYANETYGEPYSMLSPQRQAGVQVKLQQEMRTNTYNPATGEIVVSPERAAAIDMVTAHYSALFGHDPALQSLRSAYALKNDSLTSPERKHMISAFFFWAAWACTTNRPGAEVTYTNNWPSEQLVGNHPTSQVVIWSVISVLGLLAGIGALTWHFAIIRRRDEDDPHSIPDFDPLSAIKMTPSMHATLKYFWVVVALMVVQIGMGALTAHYGVEGQAFFGIPLAQLLPYAVTRTWHLQLGIFWIATAWLATGLFVAPAVSGVEPKFQKIGVNFLFVCLIIIVAGSMIGQWLGVEQRLGLIANFWFGHQGYEYVDLGRFWQSFLLIGLFLWLALMMRALAPAFKNPAENKNILWLFTIASMAIASFYGAGLMYGRHTNLAMAEYWRWWVIHLWVEGFFEVFATAVIAFLFCKMGLLKAATASAATIFATTIYLGGGIIGTMHHLYFTGTPTGVLAFGAVFSALEIVPLVLVGFEAFENLAVCKAKAWIEAYRWPIYFFVAVAFWNLVGAGLFGFLINPPIALYYMQGLNLTPVHAHTALFGVYGMLGIGLMLFCLRAMTAGRVWNSRIIGFSFWTLNIGLLAMVLLSVLPIGILQVQASIDHGMWYARSAEFMQTPLMQNLRWARVPGDTLFTIGVLSLAWFVIGLRSGHSFVGLAKPVDEPAPLPSLQPKPAISAASDSSLA